MGVANVANSFFQGYRANGGLARSAVNNASGVRTPLGNMYIGAIVVFALLYLTEFFYYIPKAALASIIISAVIFQVQYQVILPMWRSKRKSFLTKKYFFHFLQCVGAFTYRHRFDTLLCGLHCLFGYAVGTGYPHSNRRKPSVYFISLCASEGSVRYSGGNIKTLINDLLT